MLFCIDEMFARMDSDGDNMITLQDYMNRDRYYVESVKAEFNDIDTNGLLSFILKIKTNE